MTAYEKIKLILGVPSTITEKKKKRVHYNVKTEDTKVKMDKAHPGSVEKVSLPGPEFLLESSEKKIRKVGNIYIVYEGCLKISLDFQCGNYF